MYYVKLQSGDQILKVDITDENVFTDCPICGDPKPIDLEEEIRSGCSLCGTITYCESCVKLIED